MLCCVGYRTGQAADYPGGGLHTACMHRCPHAQTHPGLMFALQLVYLAVNWVILQAVKLPEPEFKAVWLMGSQKVPPLLPCTCSPSEQTLPVAISVISFLDEDVVGEQGAYFTCMRVHCLLMWECRGARYTVHHRPHLSIVYRRCNRFEDGCRCHGVCPYSLYRIRASPSAS